MTGRSGIGVLVVGFSRVGALKKHAPLVFSRARGYIIGSLFINIFSQQKTCLCILMSVRNAMVIIKTIYHKKHYYDFFLH